MLHILVAADENNGIGKSNRLLWYLPADLKHFKQLTLGHHVIMGRKTYDSISKPLPNRKNTVITHQTDLYIPGCQVVHSLEEAIADLNDQEEAFIIGGAQLYHQTIIICDTIFLTRVHHQFDADTFFPEIDPQFWELKNTNYHLADHQNEFSFSFIQYVKKQNILSSK